MFLSKHFILAFALLPTALSAQERFATRNGQITFRSETPIETIQAVNNKVTSVLDVSSGAVEFAVLIRAFEFEKALMQEHFNENYLESGKFPKATFKGKMTGLGEDELSRPGDYTVNVSGDLTIHGVVKQITTKGTISVDASGKLNAVCTFTVHPEDYNIAIPGVVRKNIAETFTVKVSLVYEKLEKAAE